MSPFIYRQIRSWTSSATIRWWTRLCRTRTECPSSSRATWLFRLWSWNVSKSPDSLTTNTTPSTTPERVRNFVLVSARSKMIHLFLCNDNSWWTSLQSGSVVWRDFATRTIWAFGHFRSDYAGTDPHDGNFTQSKLHIVLTCPWHFNWRLIVSI